MKFLWLGERKKVAQKMATISRYNCNLKLNLNDFVVAIFPNKAITSAKYFRKRSPNNAPFDANYL